MELRDNNNWMNPRNKKRFIENNGKEGFSLPTLPKPRHASDRTETLHPISP
jgi:hypothetical protein